MGQLNDIALIAQVVLLKNNQAFDTLVKKYQSPIRRFFMNQTMGDEELSNDLAQEAFIKAYTRLATFKNLSSFSTWLYRIAYNVFYDYIRSQKETSELESWEVDIHHQTVQRNVGKEMDLYQGLATLKEGERTCITLFFMEDLPIDKIATITGLPTGTIKSHLSRGKEKLAQFLKQNGYEG
ncbi:MAG: RNA polymerase sigma factor [Phocaeicola sp.]